MDAWSPRHHNGFTLIEVLVGIILVSILLAGVVSAWNLVSSMYFDLALKQKAVIALNSQTERLTALYRWCNGFASSAVSGYYSASGMTICTTQSFIAVSSSGDTTDWEKVFYANNANYVFIDRPRNIAAQFWWTPSTSCSSNLTGGNDAVCLQIFLQYPYRWNGTTAVMDSNLGPLQTLTVQTITALPQ